MHVQGAGAGYASSLNIAVELWLQGVERMLVSGMRILANVYTVDGTGLLTRGVPRRGSRRSSGPGSLAPGGVRRQGRGKNADERQCEQHGLLAVGGTKGRARGREGLEEGGREGLEL